MILALALGKERNATANQHRVDPAQSVIIGWTAGRPSLPTATVAPTLHPGDLTLNRQPVEGNERGDHGHP